MAKNNKAAPSSNSTPTWVVVSITVITLGFLGFILYLSTIPSDATFQSLKQDSQKIVQKTKQKLQDTAKSTPKPDYDFYKLLENNKVEVPKVEAYKSTPKANVNYQYRLQAASFRSKEDADRLRGNLILEGMEAYITSSETSSGVWYRVMVGPFTDRSKMNKAQDKLVARNISPLEFREEIK
ncbi:MAG: SPOR domain-containing protein [Venatoribacter sp.]